MNAIIVGPNGRPSILEMMRTFGFDKPVVLYVYRIDRKNGHKIWLKYHNDNKYKFAKQLHKTPSFEIGDKIVMWGTRVEIDIPKGVIVYNTPSKANNASNKKRAREIFEDKGIAAPKLVKNDELYKCLYPVIIRRDHHRAGIDFNLCNTDEEAIAVIKRMGNKEYYVSEVFPKTEEYRVHCASGKALLVKRKPEPDDKNIIAWNFHQNEKPWSTINRKNYDYEMILLALNAVESLGLDYGAVDIMSKPSKKGYPKHVVVEVNTAPSFTPYLINKYGAYFNLVFNSDKKLDNWDFKKFKKGPSFSWKNKQLLKINNNE